MKTNTEFREAVLIGALTLLAAWVRLYRLGVDPLWLDEAITYYRAVLPVADILKTAYLWDVHPPTYYLIMHAIVQRGDSETALRLFSALCGILSVGGAYAAVKQMHGRSTAMLAAFFLAVSLHHVRYSQEARVYALFFGISLVSFWAFHAAAVQNRNRAWYFWAALSVLNFYIHYFALVLIAAQACFFLADRIFHFTPDTGQRKWKTPLIAAGIIALGCLPQLYFFVQQAGARMQVDNGGWRMTHPAQFFLVFAKSFCCPLGLESPFWDRYLKYAALAFLAFGMAASWKQFRGVILYHGLILAFILGISYGVSFFIAIRGSFRYLIFANFPIMVLIALSAEGIASRFDQRMLRAGLRFPRRSIIIWTIAILIGAVSAGLLYDYYRTPRAENWRIGVRALQKACRKGDLVVPVPCFLDYQIKYYLRNEPDPPKFERMFEPSVQKMEAYAELYPAVFFVLSDHLSDPALKNRIQGWVAERGNLIWRDAAFPETEIWAVAQTAEQQEQSPES